MNLSWAFFDFHLNRVDPVPVLILKSANTVKPIFCRINSQLSQMALLVNISSSVSVSDSEGLRNVEITRNTLYFFFTEQARNTVLF